MQNYLIVCDYREKNIFKSENDHYSYKSIDDIINTIKLLGYNCSYFGGINELIEAIRSNEYDQNAIYLNFNDGLFTASKRGQTPILLEMMKVKYSGSSPLTHLAVSNKFFTNCFLKDRIESLNVPNCILINGIEDFRTIDLSFPIILKPNDEGSSLGINETSLCNNNSELLKQYNRIKGYGSVLAQEFVNGYELTNYFIRNKKREILFNEILLISKNGSKIMNNDFFTYEDKTNHNRVYYNPLEELKLNDVKKIKEITEQIANSLDILTLGRIDYKFYNNNLYFIEANTIPAFSITSDIGEICSIYGYTYVDILKTMLLSLD